MKKQLAIGLAALMSIGSAQAVTIFGVDGNDNLVTFDSASPSTFTSSVKITGAAGLLGLDFRPLNGTLYGLASDRIIYTINTVTGVATAASAVLTLGPISSNFGFDFNPTIDRLRIVSDADNNYVFNPNDGSLTTATNAFYDAGDVNAGLNPNITALAYTSAAFGAPVADSQLYAIDTGADILARLANSTGVLTTVGALGADIGSRDSFDILGSDAFVADGRNIYRANLASGALSLVGRTNESVFGIAIAPTVPEPATWAMMIGGFGIIGGALRRRRANVAVATA
ncbi:MAG: DUF4394 domain-containing protein [Sphingomonas sp.]|nr:DUF4394 domain-containing protein [Sphingomonas sp.]